MSKLTTFVLFVLTLSFSYSLLFDRFVDAKNEPSKLAKYYDRINEHLTKHVDSDDAELNMEEAKRWFKKKQHFVSNSMVMAMKQFISLPEAVANTSICSLSGGPQILLRNNEALNNRMRLEQDNYPLQRLDRLMEHYFYKYAQLCINQIRSLTYQNLGYGFKSIAYKKIDNLVREKYAKDYKVREIMEMIKKHLIEWEKESPTGALTEAAKQIVELETVLGENKCSSKARDILLRNERAADLTWFLMDPFLRYYMSYHAQICLEIYPIKYTKALAQFDEQTKRSLAILISEYYFGHEEYKKFGDSIDHSAYATINDDLTTPEVTQLMSKAVEFVKESNSSSWFHWNSKFYLTRDLIHKVLRSTLTESSPDYKYLFSTRDQEGNKIIDEDKVAQVYNKHILEPCLKFKGAVDKEIILPSKMNSLKVDTNTKFGVDKFMDKLGFALGQSLSTVCGYVLDAGEKQGRDLVYYMKSYQ